MTDIRSSTTPHGDKHLYDLTFSLRMNPRKRFGSRDGGAR